VADAAFLLLVVALRLRRVAGAAETSCRCQLRDRRRCVARIAALVRGLQGPMCKLRVGDPVTSRAVAANRMVVGVAIPALCLRL